MKKRIAVLLCCAVLFTACSKKPVETLGTSSSPQSSGQTAAADPSSTPEQVAQGSEASPSASPSGVAVETTQAKTIYGEVATIIGNEVTIKLIEGTPIIPGEGFGTFTGVGAPGFGPGGGQMLDENGNPVRRRILEGGQAGEGLMQDTVFVAVDGGSVGVSGDFKTTTVIGSVAEGGAPGMIIQEAVISDPTAAGDKGVAVDQGAADGKRIAADQTSAAAQGSATDQGTPGGRGIFMGPGQGQGAVNIQRGEDGSMTVTRPDGSVMTINPDQLPQGGLGGFGGRAREKVYTGEELDFIIPVGIPVMTVSFGPNGVEENELALTKIKSGNTIIVRYKEDEKTIDKILVY